MRFLNPGLLPWLWLAVLPVALHLFGRKSRAIRVSTLLFFKSLAREHRESAWRRRLKRWASLLLSVVLVCGPVLALSRLVLAPSGFNARSVVVLIDRSASMTVRDADGRTRLGEARMWVRSRLAGVPESVPVALVAYDAHPLLVHPKTTDRRALLRALDGIEDRPVEDDPAAAVAVAASIAALETPAEIWHLTDAGTEATPALPPGVVRHAVSVGLPRVLNAGITSFSVKRRPLLHSQYQAFVQVALNAAAPGSQHAIVEPRVGGLPMARRELTLVPGETQRLALDLEAAQEQVIEIDLQMTGDQLDADNHVAARLPAPRPLVVAWITPKADPFTALALQSLAGDGDLDVFTGGAAQWPPPRLPDAAIFDGWLPTPWPGGLPAIVINPPGSSGPVKALALSQPVPRESVRALDEEHPVLFRVSTSRVALAQTAVLDGSGPLQSLWLADDQPVLLAGESGSQRIVVLGFVPSLSEHLPLTPSYPLLLGNALSWCTGKSEAARAPRTLPAGSLIDVSGGAIEWREFRGGRLRDPVSIPIAAEGVVELDRLGLWRTSDGTREGGSALLSRRETDLGGAAPAHGVDAATDAARHPVWRFGGEMTQWLLGGVLLVLMAESWLFHRHAVS